MPKSFQQKFMSKLAKRQDNNTDHHFTNKTKQKKNYIKNKIHAWLQHSH